MVRLSDVEKGVAEGLLAAVLPTYDSTPWVTAPKLSEARVAIISTAGLHRIGDQPFSGHSGDYRLIPGDVKPAELTMTHLSVNFDRSGFQQDVNIALPLERLRTLAAAGEIGSVANWHYSFMGATHPDDMADAAREMTRLLKGDNVDLALLVPI